MHEPSPLATPQSARIAPVSTRRVTDAPTRMFHALFALSFSGAYLTAESEHWRTLHVALGYTLACLLAFRVLYGLIGPRHARFGPMLGRLSSVPAWLRAAMLGLRQRTFARALGLQGLSLSLVIAVVALLALVVPLVLTGHATYEEWGGEWLEDAHELFGELFLVVVMGHVGLIAGLSFMRRRNLALPMLTGRIAGAGPDLVRHERGGLAWLLLAAVSVFVVAMVW